MLAGHALLAPSPSASLVPAATDPGVCAAQAPLSSVDEVVRRVEREGIRYVFVGERHTVGPVKRFAVELANRLQENGHVTGLYVEGFRRGCEPGDDRCWSLARWVAPEAFRTLLLEARVPVRPLDPPRRDSRARRMAATIAAGSEDVRVVLVGLNHVRLADDPNAELPIFGGALSYPEPGDVAKAFPRDRTLTIGLATVDLEPSATAEDARHDSLGWADLRGNGCEYDLELTTAASADYWAAIADRVTSAALESRSAPRLDSRRTSAASDLADRAGPAAVTSD